MELSTFFQQHPQGALALSGGVDSALLAWAAGRWGSGWRAYFAHTAFQPAHELTDAQALARLCGLPLTVLEVDVLSDPQVAANPARRCYFCKRALFGAIARAAKEDGLSLIADGTNASDQADDRPGMAALAELGVRSPLRECGLTKADVRRLSREAGLPTCCLLYTSRWPGRGRGLLCAGPTAAACPAQNSRPAQADDPAP